MYKNVLFAPPTPQKGQITFLSFFSIPTVASLNASLVVPKILQFGTKKKKKLPYLFYHFILQNTHH